MPSEAISGPERAARSGASGERPSTWVFGYGSLIWRPSFPFVERVGARLEGWRRRFWQGSTDHRGIPGTPGRVVTVERAVGEACSGVAYLLPNDEEGAILEALDVREQGGYEVAVEQCELIDQRSIDALLYVATPSNRNYLGPADTGSLVAQIVRSRGPSGDNVEYVLRLAESLRELGFVDEHVEVLEDAVRQAMSQSA